MTIKDLAAETGYSVGTVSRVLNHLPNVSQKARETILRAAEESGFQLNTNAKQLKQQHGNSILVVVKGSKNELFSDLVEALQARIAETNYPLIVDYLDELENEVRRALQLSMEKKPLGILFLGGNREHFLADFAKIQVPCVLITNDASKLPFSNLSSVSSDNVQAAKMAVEHLISLGHRRIAIIGGSKPFSDTTVLRFQGSVEALLAQGISFEETKDYAGVRFSFAGGYAGARQLLQTSEGFTAIFAMSDVMAIGAIRALADAGKQVPQDVSVVGFDGLLLGEYTMPRLTSVYQSVEELAQRSVKILLEQIQGSQEPVHDTVPVTLIPKDSTRRII